MNIELPIPVNIFRNDILTSNGFLNIKEKYKLSISKCIESLYGNKITPLIVYGFNFENKKILTSNGEQTIWSIYDQGFDTSELCFVIFKLIGNKLNKKLTIYHQTKITYGGNILRNENETTTLIQMDNLREKETKICSFPTRDNLSGFILNDNPHCALVLPKSIEIKMKNDSDNQFYLDSYNFPRFHKIYICGYNYNNNTLMSSIGDLTENKLIEDKMNTLKLLDTLFNCYSSFYE